VNEHLTSEQISAWLTGEQPADAARHAHQCPACRAELESLRETFAQFRESGERWSAHHMASPAPVRGRSRMGWAAAVAVASSVLAAAVLIQKSAPAPAVHAEQPFIAIPYVAPLAPYERASVMRMDVPVAALVAAGFQVHGTEPGSTVSADVLVGQDGRAHAVRLISNGSVIQ
jgi:hypothetical protein